MFESLVAFVEGLPVWAQWLGVTAVSAIPFVESYGGSVIGVLVGVPPAAAIVAAVVGNVISMVLVVLLGHAARDRVLQNRDEPEVSPRRQKLRRAFDRFGVPGVSLLGQTILPSQITSGAMVSFGASRNAVIAWQCLSIVLWGVAFGLLAQGGVTLLR
ncbi:hypothetical protein GCM10028784_01780 [Myceligenerans cantabricum]